MPARTPTLSSSEDSDDDLLERSASGSTLSSSDSEFEPDCGVPGQDLKFEQVVREERELLEQRRLQRCDGGGTGQGFALAFSGGGVRAAAFQAGVLWRLAETGRLQDVEYFAAVSGGGYIAASYASHILAAEPPENACEVKRWLRSVVARSICRMQRNAGNFVRDCAAAPGFPTDGAGWCPRICDLPLLLLVLIVTIGTSPVMFFVTILIPLVEVLEIFFGAVLRDNFCTQESQVDMLWQITFDDNVKWLVFALVYVTVVSFLIWLGSHLPCINSKAARSRRPRPFLLMHSTLAALMRLAFVLFILLLLLYTVPMVEFTRHNVFKNTLGEASRHHVCFKYMCGNQTRGLQPCESSLHSQGALEYLQSHDCSWLPGAHMEDSQKKVAPKLMGAVWMALGITLLASVLLQPCFPCLLATVVMWLGPVFLLIFTFLLLQFRVFAPMTHENLLTIIPYHESWMPFVRRAAVVGLLVMLFSDYLLSLWHWYYKRCLQINFFDGGLDRTWEEIRKNAFCPLLIVTGTVNDFMRPTDKRSISEISFSPLHVGSMKCGYVRMLPFKSLARTTALTGAGCLDALSLSMSNRVRTRFWLEVLNLGWGDYILFRPFKQSWMRTCAKRAGSPRLEQEVYFHLHRAPTAVLWLFTSALFVTGWSVMKDPSEDNCRCGRRLLLTSIGLGAAMLGLSFFAHLPCLSFLMHSPVVRRLQEASRFYFRGEKPPGTLYVTDGGVQDCTAVVQLLRRRCERILLVLAAADPKDELGVLRKAMSDSESGRLCCFFDPVDARKDVKIMLEEFKKDRRVTYLHIGIRYGWDVPAERATYGRLIVVKNRLVEAACNQPVRPLLTEEEICGGARDQGCGDQWGDMLEEELGGFCCCDCCHRRCNAGPKFPHTNVTGYMYLTPQLFSSLCRLGHDVSEEAILAATAP